MAIPPSRARRQLQARLAEKKRLADKDSAIISPPLEPDEGNDMPSLQSSLASAAPGPSQTLNIAKPTEDTSSSSEEDDADDDDDDEPPAPSKPFARTSSMTALSSAHLHQDSAHDSSSSDSDDGPTFATSARPSVRAHAARRPLDDASSSDDDDDDSDDDDAAPALASRSARRAAPAPAPAPDSDEEEDEVDITPDDGIDVEDYWRLGELRQAAAQRAALATSASASTTAPASASAAPKATAQHRGAGSRGSLGTRDLRVSGAVPSGALSRQRAQERLTAQWSASHVGEEDEDPEDRPVEMGTKYLPTRRASLQSNREKQG